MKEEEIGIDGHRNFPFLLKETTMLKNLAIMISVALLFFVSGCNIKTPEIRGVVLDAETKQPVENAWVTATLEVYSKTVAGDVHQSLFVGKTWSDKNGKFLIPAKEFRKPSFPVSLGGKIESLDVGAEAAMLKDFVCGGIKLKELNEDRLILYLKSPKNMEYYFLALQGLYSYIFTGRLGVAVPLVPEAERLDVMDLGIRAHELFLENYSEEDLRKFKEHEEKQGGYITANYSTVLRQLAYLFKKEGYYKKALETFEKVKSYEEKHGIKLNMKEYENQIKELQQLLQQKQ
jgi:hypothetical protein